MDLTAIRLECLKLAAALGTSAAEILDIAERLYAFATRDLPGSSRS